MLACVRSYALEGLDGYAVDVEVDVNNGLPSVETVGLASTATKESKERVRAAIRNSGFPYPMKRITVNLAPADTRKEGAALDLPIAVGLLVCAEAVRGTRYKEFAMVGELALNGEIRSVSGIMPLLISAMQNGVKKFIVPAANAKEAGYIDGIEVYALSSLRETADFLNGEERLPVPRTEYSAASAASRYGIDLADVKGQAAAKRAIEIAVAGGHNVLMCGAPGAGKTMLAKCVPTIMPDMTFSEAVEVTKIHSVAGVLDPTVGIVCTRPFRTPHHTATVPALVGGGSKVRPGEVSLAHNGVLFLDEMPEYSRHALETLRQPLEDKRVTVARAARSVEYPANFMLVASMNPCPCGNYGSRTQPCRCSAAQIHAYTAKLSGPLLDRIDLYIEVDGVEYAELRGSGAGETSAAVKERVEKARAIQRERFEGKGFSTNSHMSARDITRYCALDGDGERLLQKAFDKMGLTARGATRILKVARTVADLGGSDNILATHLAEAIRYRSMERNSIR